MTLPPPPSSSGPTRLVARMADLLTVRGSPYPMAGALACAVRGRLALDFDTYARSLGLTTADVEAAESGETPLRALPAAIADRIPWLGLDLTALSVDEAA